MQRMTGISPQSGQLSRFKFIAINWSEPSEFFKSRGINRKNLYRLKQDLKKKYPEILITHNPLVASVLSITQ